MGNENPFVFGSVEKLSDGQLLTGADLKWDVRWKQTKQLLRFTAASGLSWPLDAVEDQLISGDYLALVNANDLQGLSPGRIAQIRLFREQDALQDIEGIERLLDVLVSEYSVESP